MDLVHDIVESGRLVTRSRRDFTLEANVLDPEAPPMSQEEIDQVLARERAEQELPEPPTFTPVEEEGCQCPACRRKRRSSRRGSGQYKLFDDFSKDDGIGFGEGSDLEDFDELEDLENLEDFDDLAPDLDSLPLPPGLEDMPPDVLLLLLEFFEKYGSRKGELPDLDELRKRDPKLYARLDKAFRRMEREETLGPPPTRKKRRRKKRH
jgi:hypothetical protein